ncbi:hypothetical protein GT354_19985, partial [Streptomyces sp. SID3343]|nr:hypothetical protein [Streptomyces sp. SID3343]
MRFGWLRRHERHLEEYRRRREQESPCAGRAVPASPASAESAFDPTRRRDGLNPADPESSSPQGSGTRGNTDGSRGSGSSATPGSSAGSGIAGGSGGSGDFGGWEASGPGNAVQESDEAEATRAEMLTEKARQLTRAGRHADAAAPARAAVRM